MFSPYGESTIISEINERKRNDKKSRSNTKRCPI